jgi:hypothetical protein
MSVESFTLNNTSMNFFTYKTVSRRGRTRSMGIGFLLISATIYILFAMPMTEQVIGYMEIQPVIQWSLQQPKPGSFQTVRQRGDRVETDEILFREITSSDHLDFELADCVIEGNRVDSGARIALFGSWSNDYDLQQLRNEYDVVRANITFLKSGSRPEDIEVAQYEFEIAEQKLNSYKTEYERIKAIHDLKYISDSEFETSENKYLVLSKELELARAKLKASKAGESSERISIEVNTLRKLDNQIHSLEQSKVKDEITAPFSGVFIHPKESTTLCTIAQIDEMTVKILIREQDLMYVLADEKFVVRPFAYPKLKFTSKIEFIQSTPTIINNQSYFVAIGHIDNSDQVLMPGMLGTARIFGKRTNVFNFVYYRIRNTLFAQFGV